MGLLPIIYTALTIFTIGLTVILVISYILYRLNPNHKKPYTSKVQNKNSRENLTPVYSPIPLSEDVHIYNQPKRKNRENYRQPGKNRFEVLNNFNRNYYQLDKTTPRTFNNSTPFYGFNVQYETTRGDGRMPRNFN